MVQEPHVEERAGQPYVAVGVTVAADGVTGAVNRAHLLDPSQLTDPQRWEVRLDYLLA